MSGYFAFIAPETVVVDLISDYDRSQYAQDRENECSTCICPGARSASHVGAKVPSVEAADQEFGKVVRNAASKLAVPQLSYRTNISGFDKINAFSGRTLSVKRSAFAESNALIRPEIVKQYLDTMVIK